ncbi:hypothetical protein M514_12513 [Trichuris suis]|uniref:Uncharacterized protein n=1 Tax=Trichuris suis TaxID=68888 RepID=A0A085N0V7_9BILA|nr:hypothetical protein M514_12513 [Trichuris suis]
MFPKGERERSNVEMVSVCSTYESPIVRADLRSTQAYSNQSLETPSDMYSAELHSLENINDFETPMASFRKDSSQQLIGQMMGIVNPFRVMQLTLILIPLRTGHERTKSYGIKVLLSKRDLLRKKKQVNAVSTPKARNENGLDIYVDDFGLSQI